MLTEPKQSLGLKTTQGMYLTDSWYWNRDADSRAWSRKFFEKMKANDQIVVRYVNAAGERAEGANPNGALDDIAGVCNDTRNVFGMMPHAEAFLHRTNHPRWTGEELPDEGQGVALFRNAVDYLRNRRN